MGDGRTARAVGCAGTLRCPVAIAPGSQRSRHSKGFAHSTCAPPFMSSNLPLSWVGCQREVCFHTLTPFLFSRRAEVAVPVARETETSRSTSDHAPRAFGFASGVCDGGSRPRGRGRALAAQLHPAARHGGQRHQVWQRCARPPPAGALAAPRMGCIDEGAQVTHIAHQSAPQGVDRLAEAVKVTLGPKVRMPCSDCLVHPVFSGCVSAPPSLGSRVCFGRCLYASTKRNCKGTLTSDVFLSGPAML